MASTSTSAMPTTPRLAFEKVGLVGRDKEVRVLLNAIRHQPKATKNPFPTKEVASSIGHVNGPTSTLSRTTTRSISGSSTSGSSNHVDNGDLISSELATISPSPDGIRAQIRSLVLVSGQSGSGKSALIEEARKRLLGRTDSLDNPHEGSHGGVDTNTPFRGFFVTGKCELSTKKEGVPYSGIQPAMMELCEQVAGRIQEELDTSTDSHPSRQGSEVKQETLASLVSKGLTATETELLSHVIPNIEMIKTVTPSQQVGGGINVGLAKSSNPSTSHQDVHNESISVSTFSLSAGGRSSIDYKSHTQRVTYVLRRFMQILCRYCPVVMVIDDLQWADRASLDLIQSWLLDSCSASLTIIGLYRSNMMDANQTLNTTLASLEESKRERSIRIIKLSVEDLSVDEVAAYLQRLFQVSSHQEDEGDHPDCQMHIDTDHSEAEPSLAHLMPLAQIVHAKTGGNMFFIQQYLDSLVMDGLIVQTILPSAGATAGAAANDASRPPAWIWDINTITSDSEVLGDTIIDLMKMRLRKSASKHWVLSIAACLGATFSASHVCAVTMGLFIHSSHSKFFRKVFQVTKMTKETEIMSMLKTFCSEALIEKVKSSRARTSSLTSTDDGSRRMSSTNKSTTANATANANANTKRSKSLQYSFIHDKVQEAALSMIPTEDQLSELKYRVGEILLYALSDDELNDKIFMITNLLNTRPDLMPTHRKLDRRMKIILLNHKAGQQAANASAFHLASSYFDMAINLLPDDHWETSSEQSLELYSSAAEIHFMTTSFAKAQSYCKIIINQDCDMLMKVRAHHVLIGVASAETNGTSGEGPVDRCLDLLSQLGCTFPTSSLGRAMYILRGLMRAKSTIRRFETEMEHSLSLSNDQHNQAIMKTLDKLSLASYLNAPELVPVLAAKILRLSLKQGITMYSGIALTLQGILVAFVLEDIDLAYRCGRLALRIAKASDDRSLDAKIQLYYHTMLYPWRHPLEDSFEAVVEVSRIGMSTGDVESATWSLHARLATGMLVGKPLAPLDNEALLHTNTMRDYQQNAQYHLSLIVWQAVLNLRGASNHTTKLIGDAYDETKEVYEDGHPTETVQNRVKGIYQLYLATYFGEYELGSQIAIQSGHKWPKEMPSSGLLYPTLFLCAFCCLCMAHECKPSYYTKHARKFMKILKRWKKKGNPNCSHYITLLEAEESFLKKRGKKAIERYEAGIKEMQRRKYTANQALANERFSMFYASRGEEEKAAKHLKASIDLYKEWGANKKVEMLLQQCGSDCEWAADYAARRHASRFASSDPDGTKR